jgi:hypothetical protein
VARDVAAHRRALRSRAARKRLHFVATSRLR